MEEDIALANIALDQLGVARLLLTYAGELEGAGRDEDELAYLRDDREFRNALLVELPNGDFAVTHGEAALPGGVPAAALHGAGRLRGRAVGRDRREGAQGVGVPPGPRRAVGDAARRRHRGVAPSDAGRASTSCGRTRTSCSPRTRRRRSTRPTLRPAFDAGRRPGARRGDADPAGQSAGRRPVGGPACTPSTWPTCSPRCRCCTAPTPGRSGERASRAPQGQPTGGRGGVVDPEIRVVTIDELGILRAVEEDRPRPGHRTITPTYTGCPAMDVIRADIRRRSPPPATRTRRSDRLQPAVEHRLDHRRWAGQARRRRDRPAGPGAAPPASCR